nr:MAG TPA: hypothetical protein [Bacteriophage sp.]
MVDKISISFRFGLSEDALYIISFNSFRYFFRLRDEVWRVFVPHHTPFSCSYYKLFLFNCQ